MHQQLYVPESYLPEGGYKPEGYVPESGSHAKPSQGGQAAATGKFEQKAERIEKGVGRFLKKLDRKF
jgi:hypothetical protein